MILYTADLHFGHKSVIGFDHRPFSDVDEMDAALIKLWNRRVRAEDHVYIIGDFAYRSEKGEEWYLRQLKGHKHLIIGNHDKRTLDNPAAMHYFESVDKMMHVTDNGTEICLCHFPIAEWNGYHKGHTHIYGHIHSDRGETYRFMRTRKNALNAGCMINGYSPVSLRELIRNNETWNEEREERGETADGN